MLLVLAALAAGLAVAASPAAAAGPEPPMAIDRIGASMPTVDSVPGAGLRPRSSRLHGTDEPRAPHPCADRDARTVPGTDRWGEWEARGTGRRVRVITFSYGDAKADEVWRSLKAAIAACPRELPYAFDGGKGSSRQIVRSVTRDAVVVDIVTRSADGRRAWGEDRAITYQRVGDAIQKAMVIRQTLTAGDRRLMRRLARVSSARYLDARAGTGVLVDLEAPGELETGPQITDPSAPIRDAVAKLTPGQTLNVSLGDSFISGEAGRWRGNVFWHLNYPRADVGGPQAYWDTPAGEAIRGCHRSQSAEIHVPGTVSVNLACSGAITTSMFKLGNYKPGIDDGMADPKTGRPLPGQLTMLDEAARSGRVGTVVLSIGGNDMGFSKVILACVAAFMKPWPFQSTCENDAATRQRLSDSALAEVGGKVEAAIVRIHRTMEAAGYEDGSWQMIVQNYALPVTDEMRYPETYAGRVVAGGCPLYSSDVRWVRSRIPTFTAELRGAAQRAGERTGQPVRFLDVNDALAGRELCAKDAAHVDDLTTEQVVAQAERAQSLRVFPPWNPLEAIHPNQLGQLALRACLREALNNGTARSGRCDAPADWSQVDATGLPLMRFTPTL